MPSVSGRQHRQFGYWKSHPEDRPSSLSASQVDEWLSADRGSPWKHRDSGGGLPSEFGRGIVRGGSQALSELAHPANALEEEIAGWTGNENLRRLAEADVARTGAMDEATRRDYAPSVPSLKDIHGMSDAGHYTAGKLGEAVPAVGQYAILGAPGMAITGAVRGGYRGYRENEGDPYATAAGAALGAIPGAALGAYGWLRSPKAAPAPIGYAPTFDPQTSTFGVKNPRGDLVTSGFSSHQHAEAAAADMNEAPGIRKPANFHVSSNRQPPSDIDLDYWQQQHQATPPGRETPVWVAPHPPVEPKPESPVWVPGFDAGGGVAADQNYSNGLTIPITPGRIADIGIRGYENWHNNHITPRPREDAFDPAVAARWNREHDGQMFASPQPPSQHRGGPVQYRQMGGSLGMMNPASGGILPGSVNPMMQGQMQQLAQMPEEKLQELAMRMPGNPMVSRALAMRRMHTAANAGMSPTPAPSSGSGILPQQEQARGGSIEHRQGGGSMLGMPLGEASPWWERSSERGMEEGYLHGNTFGRADHLTTTAPGGSYIVPADVISGIGEGNSLAGASAVEHMLNTGPWGTPLRGGRRGRGAPSAPRPVIAPHQRYEAKGGGVQGDDGAIGHPVPVKLSHGEYQISPRRVLMIGRHLLRKHGGKGTNDKLAMKLGHDALDEWVKHERKRIVAKMKALPGPTRATGGRLAARRP